MLLYGSRTKKHVRFSGVSEMNGNATVSLNGWINGSLTRKLNVMRRTNEAHNRSCADSVPLILLPPGWAAHWTLYLGLRPGAVKKASSGKEKALADKDPHAAGIVCQ